MALPLGAVLCFFDLLAARIFARGELTIQCRFHYPLSHLSPHPPRPIFTRYRQPTVSEVESGRRTFVREASFYRNTYAMVDARIPSLIHAHFSFSLQTPPPIKLCFISSSSNLLSHCFSRLSFGPWVSH